MSLDPTDVEGPYGFDEERGELDPLVNFYAHWDQLSARARDAIIAHAPNIANALHAQGSYMIRNCNAACEMWLNVFDRQRIDAHMRGGHYWVRDQAEQDALDPPLSTDHVWLVVEGHIFDPTAAQFVKEPGQQIDEKFYLDTTPRAEEFCHIQQDTNNPLRYTATHKEEGVEIAALELKSLPRRWGNGMQVGNIEVDAGYRRCGIGRLLFAQAERDWGPVEHDWAEIGALGMKWAQGMEAERGHPFEHETRVEHESHLPPLLLLPEGFEVRLVRDEITKGWAFCAMADEDQYDEIGHLVVDPKRQICGVFVEDEYTGRGVATALFREATRVLGRLQHSWDDMSDQGREWAHKMEREMEWSEKRAIDAQVVSKSPGWSQAPSLHFASLDSIAKATVTSPAFDAREDLPSL